MPAYAQHGANEEQIMSDAVKIAAAQIDVQLGRIEHNLARILAYSARQRRMGRTLLSSPSAP